mmetsp:Transcript_71141/g.141052  ORF Transcript_71141/g.141052 Transcript_71141/m.141052 type:complete len:220 (-) Transcript_71141:33-692(-)
MVAPATDAILSFMAAFCLARFACSSAFSRARFSANSRRFASYSASSDFASRPPAFACAMIRALSAAFSFRMRSASSALLRALSSAAALRASSSFGSSPLLVLEAAELRGRVCRPAALSLAALWKRLNSSKESTPSWLASYLWNISAAKSTGSHLRLARRPISSINASSSSISIVPDPSMSKRWNFSRSSRSRASAMRRASSYLMRQKAGAVVFVGVCRL